MQKMQKTKTKYVSRGRQQSTVHELYDLNASDEYKIPRLDTNNLPLELCERECDWLKKSMEK